MSISTRTEDADLHAVSYGSKEPPPEEMRDGVHYPDTDGEEMGENDWHDFALSVLYGMLRERYEGQAAYVAADMMLYHERGNPKAVRAPDCMVILGVDPRRRRSWLAWEEGSLPAVVFEMVSPRTYDVDFGPKREVDERIGIPEYILFDPTDIQMGAIPLRGFRLRDGKYEEIEPVGGDGIISEQLGLMIYPEGEILRLVDMETRRFVRTHEETRRLLQRDRRYRDLKRSFRIARGEALLGLQAEREKAEAETQRADQLAAEVERLRALLGPGASDRIKGD